MQATALISEFLVPGIVIMFSLAGLLDAATSGSLLSLLKKYMIYERDQKTGLAIDSVAWTALGFGIISLSYVIGLLTNFFMYNLVQKKVNAGKAGEVLRQYELSYVREIGEWIRFDQSAMDILQIRLRQTSSDWEKTARSDKKAFNNTAEKLFGRMWGYIRVLAPQVQEDMNFYISIQRICRGYAGALSLLSVAVLFEAKRFNFLVDDKGIIDLKGVIIVSSLIIIFVFLVIVALWLLRHAVVWEYEARARAFGPIMVKAQASEAAKPAAESHDAKISTSSEKHGCIFCWIKQWLCIKTHH